MKSALFVIRRRVLFFLLIHVVIFLFISVPWAFWKINHPLPRFIGSYPRRAIVQKNNLDLNNQGAWFGRFWNEFRPHGPFEIFSPTLHITPFIHYFWGFDVFSDSACMRGYVLKMRMSKIDGDVNILVLPDSNYLQFATPASVSDKAMRGRILVEIPPELRDNFPVLYDIAVQDKIFVCGRFVFDRNHGGLNEIHPPYWIEILN